MDPLEQRLTDAGAAWRGSQRPPTELSGFAPAPVPRGWATPVRALVGIAAAFAVVAGTIALTPRTQQGGQQLSPTDSGDVAAAPTPPATPGPTPTTFDVGDRYPDGIPKTIDAEHVYRPTGILEDPPTGEFLLGGWDAGNLTVSCPIQQPGSSISCPHFEGLAEVRDGPSVVPMTWDGFSSSVDPAFVLRVTALPAVACLSNPPGACPGPSVKVLELIWMGDPRSNAATRPWPPIVCGRLSTNDCRLVESIVVSWFGSKLPGDATVLADAACPPGAPCAAGFDVIAVVLVPGSPPTVGSVLSIRGLSYPDSLYQVGVTAIPPHIRAMIPAEVPLPS